MDASQTLLRNIWKHLQSPFPENFSLGRLTVTRQDDLHQVPLLDLGGRAQQLEDVLRGLVVTEQQDLVVHPVEHTLGYLQKHREGRSRHGGDQQGATLQNPDTRYRASSGPGGSVSFVVNGERRFEGRKKLLNIKRSDRFEADLHTS